MTDVVPNASFWDLDSCKERNEECTVEQTDAIFDVAIVGGGILGCSIARRLHNQAPHLRCVVIERWLRPVGASTRNAGFACFGSVGEICADIDAMGAPAARNLVTRRVEGLRLLRSTVTDQEMGYQGDGGNEIFLGDDSALERIDEVNELLDDVFPEPPFALRDDLIPTYGLSSTVKHLIHTPYEGMLHSGKLLNVMQHQQEITGTVVNISDEADGSHKLSVIKPTTRQTTSPQHITIHARNVVLATNAWLQELAPDLSVIPARGQVLVTKPIAELKLRGTFHMNEGYVYFRNVGQRVLLGGGRNLDFNAERTTELSTTDRIQEYLEHLLTTYIAPNSQPQIDMRWSGVMAFTPNKQPLITEVRQNIWAALTCNGMGVALASKTAADVADVVLQHDSRT